MDCSCKFFMCKYIELRRSEGRGLIFCLRGRLRGVLLINIGNRGEGVGLYGEGDEFSLGCVVLE